MCRWPANIRSDLGRGRQRIRRHPIQHPQEQADGERRHARHDLASRSCGNECADGQQTSDLTLAAVDSAYAVTQFSTHKSRQTANVATPATIWLRVVVEMNVPMASKHPI